MRKLTFHSFMRRYITELTGIERFELKKLAAASEQAERLRVPFLLYLKAAELPQEKLDTLLGTVCRDEFSSVLGGITDPVEQARSLPTAYQRVIGGFVRLSRTHEAENERKRRLSRRIAERRRGLDLTDYRICRELNLNPGNFNAFFYHGNDNALSLDKVDLILKFIEFCRERLLDENK